MLNQTRRDFLKTGSAAALLASTSLRSWAQTLHLPLGIQLYSVRDMLPNDYAGTLKKVGERGYKECESAGYYNHSASEVRSALDAAGLKLVSAHYSMGALQQGVDDAIQFSKQLGTVEYIICSSPIPKPSSGQKQGEHTMTLEDWQWNAEQLNKFGEKVHAAGLKFGYHNHYTEFKEVDGHSPYDELMRMTDPAKVHFEMDCGWVTVGGGDPVALLKKYASRVVMLHVKDFKKPDTPGAHPEPTELGQGYIDYKPIFHQAALSGHIRHVFVEQEAFDVPAWESLKIDADYMQGLGMK
jgi:sugar phosphate isomerase/epimerase